MENILSNTRTSLKNWNKYRNKKDFSKSQRNLLSSKHCPELLNSWRIYPIIYTSLPSSRKTIPMKKTSSDHYQNLLKKNVKSNQLFQKKKIYRSRQQKRKYSQHMKDN